MWKVFCTWHCQLDFLVYVVFKLNLIGVSVWQLSLTLASTRNVIDIIFICVCIWCLNQKNYFTNMGHVFHVERSDFDMEWPGRTTDLQLGNTHSPPQTIIMVNKLMKHHSWWCINGIIKLMHSANDVKYNPNPKHIFLYFCVNLEKNIYILG